MMITDAVVDLDVDDQEAERSRQLMIEKRTSTNVVCTGCGFNGMTSNDD